MFSLNKCNRKIHIMVSNTFLAICIKGMTCWPTLRKDFVILQLYWWLFSSTNHCSWNMVYCVVIVQSYFPSYNYQQDKSTYDDCWITLQTALKIVGSNLYCKITLVWLDSSLSVDCSEFLHRWHTNRMLFRLRTHRKKLSNTELSYYVALVSRCLLKGPLHNLDYPLLYYSLWWNQKRRLYE